MILGDLADNLFRRANNLHCLPDWQRMLRSYMEVLTIAFQHENFADEDIKEFQDAVYAWYYQYIELLGLESMHIECNMHMTLFLLSNHFSCFFRNL